MVLHHFTYCCVYFFCQVEPNFICVDLYNFCIDFGVLWSVASRQVKKWPIMTFELETPV